MAIVIPTQIRRCASMQLSFAAGNSSTQPLPKGHEQRCSVPKLVALLLLASAVPLPVCAQIGPNHIKNSIPSLGVPYVREGFEPTTESGPFGDNFNNDYTDYHLRNIDHWKYERVIDNGDRYHSVTFDHDTQASDKSYFSGDRRAGFIQSSSSWGNEHLPVQIRRTKRTILRFDVRSRYAPGYTSYFHSTLNFAGDPMNFARETLVTDTVFQRPNNGGTVTLWCDHIAWNHNPNVAWFESLLRCLSDLASRHGKG